MDFSDAYVIDKNSAISLHSSVKEGKDKLLIIKFNTIRTCFEHNKNLDEQNIEDLPIIRNID